MQQQIISNISKILNNHPSRIKFTAKQRTQTDLSRVTDKRVEKRKLQ